MSLIKTSLLFCFILVVSLQAIAQNDKLQARKDLQELLLLRKAKFDSFTISLEKHSGFFGNRTKNDMQNSNSVLVDIVKTDNRIISVLNSVIDFRTYEKVNMNYDMRESGEKLENLLQATDTLAKQVTVLTASNKALKVKSQILKWIIFLLVASFTGIIIWMRRKGYFTR